MLSAPRRLVDYHVHSRYSIDGRSSVDEMCRQAIRLGLAEIGFCEHVDFQPQDHGVDFLDYEKYSEGLDRARSQYGSKLTIRKGAELDFSPMYLRQIREWLDGKTFDFLMGSVHYVDDIAVDLGNGLKMHPEIAIRKYYLWVSEAAKSRLFNVIGHLDLIRREVPSNQDPIAPALDVIDSMFTQMVRDGVYLEINSRRRTDQEPFPCRRLIQEYLKCGGELFSFGSDAHSSQHIAAGVPQAMNLLRSLEPKTVRVLFQRDDWGNEWAEV